MDSFPIPAGLLRVRAAFQEIGCDLRLVGGCVRDHLAGAAPKDIDLCVDATPEDQIVVYARNGFRYVPTGLRHGTITVVIDGAPYEITSLRTETEHDGRHATVAYTKDWIEDLSRRDLTINAMMLTFDGELIDPFHGWRDLRRRAVRFVGDPGQRMAEDYLRILRWFRFHGRLAPSPALHSKTAAAVRANARGLDGISRERVWSEMQRIIAGRFGPQMMKAILRLGLADYIDLPQGSVSDLAQAYDHTRDPVTLMAAYVRDVALMDLLTRKWKWSVAERDQAMFLCEFLYRDDITSEHIITVHDKSRHYACELAVLHNRPATAQRLRTWPIPVFPVRGQDLIDAGLTPGPQIGAALAALKRRWVLSNYGENRADLLASLAI